MVTYRVEIQPPAWLRNRQEDARLKITTRYDRMHVHVRITLIVFFIVADRGPGVAIRRHAGKCDGFKGIKHFGNLCVGGFILGRPGDDGMQVAVFEWQTVCDLSDEFRIAAQDLHARPLAL